MKEYLISLASYNVWAHQRIYDYVMEAGEEACAFPQKSSFPTVKDTMIHIWDAQHIWLDRIEGNPVVDWPGKSFKGSSIDAVKGLIDNSELWVSFVKSIKEEMLENQIHYSNIKGVPFSNSLKQIITHVMNHSTYHRGQLITLLRGAGFTNPGTTDLIAYFRELKS